MLKTKTKILYIVLGFLAVTLIANIIRTNIKGERSFRTQLVEVDSKDIDKLVIENSGKILTFVLDNNKWTVSQEAVTYKADANMVNSIISELASLKIERLVSKEKAKLREFEVDDSLGTKVKLFSKNKKSAELVVGRFSYRQTGRGGIQLSTMIRLASETDIYSVEGALSMSLKRDFDSFRDKTILSFDPDKLQRLEYKYPGDSSFTLSRTDGGWVLNRDTVDVGKVVNFLNEIKETKANGFAPKNTQQGADEFQLTATIDGSAPIIVKAYKSGEKYVFVSTTNEDPLNDSDSVFKKLFVSAKKFSK